MLNKLLPVFAVLTLLLSACQAAAPAAIPVTIPVAAEAPAIVAPVIQPSAVPTTAFTATQSKPISTTRPVETTQPSPTAVPSQAPIGPVDFPSGVNPLTGLPVQNPSNLLLPPALVSVTNFPVSARPQAGLSFSPVVYEMYIGEGMSRFLAVFYGDYPKEALNNDSATSNLTAAIGPIRSGRLPYESLRKLYNGFLVMASAYKTVAAQLNEYTNIYASDSADVNSAMIDATKLEDVAKAREQQLGQNALSGLRFQTAAPAGGQDGQVLWLPYNFLNQIFWRYNQADGSYHRFQDQADGKTFTEFTDRLNGQPLTYQNVVVLFADHHRYAETLIDIDLSYITKMPALLFRDGKMYPIYWTSKNEEYEKTTGKVRPIRFIDAAGNPFPLKPGQTWVEIVPRGTRYNETVDSQLWGDLKGKTQPGSGIWAVHFYVPEMEEPPKN